MSKKMTIKERLSQATSMMSPQEVAPPSQQEHMSHLPERKISVSMGLQQVGFGQENQRLKKELEQWSGALPTLNLDTATVVPSKFANRMEGSFTDKDFKLLKDDIESAGGNIQPIKVRPVPRSAPPKYEIVFGHRRHRACSELGIKVLAVVESIDDKSLFAEMDRENRQRKDLRPYEQGVMYARALDDGLFPSMRKLAEELGIEAGNASKVISLARLPKAVVMAFDSPLSLQQNWAPVLSAALEKAPELVIQRAKVLSETTPRLPAKEVFKQLTAMGVVSDNTVLATKVIKSAGKKIARLKSADGIITVEFEKSVLSAANLEKLENFIKSLLFEKTQDEDDGIDPRDLDRATDRTSHEISYEELLASAQPPVKKSD